MDILYEHLPTDKAKLRCTVSMSVFCFPAKKNIWVLVHISEQLVAQTKNSIDDLYSTVEFGWVHYIH